MNINITEKAQQEIKRIAAEQDLQEIIVRAKVVGGSCSGIETKLELDNTINEGDVVVELTDMKLVVDKRSALYLSGTDIDFYSSLEKNGFIVNNPNVIRCGCKSAC